jgi:hypothetical protein
MYFYNSQEADFAKWACRKNNRNFCLRSVNYFHFKNVIYKARDLAESWMSATLIPVKSPIFTKYSLSKGSHSWHPSTMGGSAPNEIQTRDFCLFGVSACHFRRTPESMEEILTRHCRMLLMDEVCTKSKEFGPVVEGQEEQQFSDGTDGPSKYTDVAVSHATDIVFG